MKNVCRHRNSEQCKSVQGGILQNSENSFTVVEEDVVALFVQSKNKMKEKDASMMMMTA